MDKQIFLGSITHDGRIDANTAIALLTHASRQSPAVAISQMSLINMNCNKLWCMALNMKPRPKWFAMLHSDIIPEAWWLDKLIEEAELHNAVMLSAVVPIKDDVAKDMIELSTALSNPFDSHWSMFRLNAFKVRTDFPVTFDAVQACRALKLSEAIPRKLLLNTGCMICRVDLPWAEKVIFKCEERIVEAGGEFIAQTDSEDWNFSRQVSEYGRVMATSAIRLKHVGNKSWSNW